MELFTVDRAGTLDEGLVCELVEYQDIQPPEIEARSRAICPGGVALHGELYLLKNQRCTSVIDADLEMLFDLVRRANHKDRPSRYQCLYAVNTLGAAVEMAAFLGIQSPRIFQLQSETAFRADMRLLHSGFSALVKYHFAELYWDGLPMPEGRPMWEWLVPCPVVIGKRIA